MATAKEIRSKVNLPAIVELLKERLDELARLVLEQDNDPAANLLLDVGALLERGAKK